MERRREGKSFFRQNLPTIVVVCLLCVVILLQLSHLTDSKEEPNQDAIRNANQQLRTFKERIQKAEVTKIVNETKDARHLSDNSTLISNPAVPLFDSFMCSRHPSRIALVIPFISGQLDRLEENMKSWITDTSFPCDPSFVSNLPHKIHIVFNHNSSPDPSLEQSVTKIWNSIKNEKFLWRNGRSSIPTHNTTLRSKTLQFKLEDCFSGFSFLYANQDETISPATKNDQFRKLFEHLPKYQPHPFDYFFLMEPDCYPTRARWLDRLYIESICGEEFWVKGSAYRTKGIAEHVELYGNHINGNALYNVKDAEFVSLVSELILKWHKSKYPYDVVLWKMWDEKTEWSNQHTHLYKHVSWVYNYGNKWDRAESTEKRSWTEELANEREVYFVHGLKS